MTTEPDSGNRKNTGKPNRLVHETSPYLQQHARNPVDWYPWGEEALEKARKENRMIFLSIGYSSCHWCHVMERESFEDTHVANLLNKHFVNIKVDREERPDVDAVYMEALQMMTGQGGWPLNVWLTPDQVPVFAGTYFPPEDAHGRPGFPTVIRRLAEVYRNNPDKVKEQADEMRNALANDIYDHLSAAKITNETLEKAYHGFTEAYDEEHGGFSGAPKFPMAMGIGFLLRYGHRPGSEQAHKMALTSLEMMISGGIYDQVGGGFHRYSTDEKWMVPHFEKMLYDNALLLPVLAGAARLGDYDLFSATAEETIAFLNREMRHPDGAYYSALDADTEGEEGKFYTFTSEELREQLDDELYQLMAEHYGVRPEGNREGVNILYRAVPLDEIARRRQTDVATLRQKRDKARSALLEYRNRRTRPGLDDKIITSWNALMLIGLCRCSQWLGRDPADAIRLGTFLAEHTLKDNTLYRIVDRDGNIKQPGFLDDYALLADGFSHLFEVTGEAEWLSLSVRLAEQMLEQFYDEEKAAFRYSARNRDALITDTRDVFDNAVPGGSTAAITALHRLGHLAGRPDWTRTAITAMESLSEPASTHAPAFGYLLQTMHQHLHPGKEIVIVSPSTPAGDPVVKEMVGLWQKNFDPGSCLVIFDGRMRSTGRIPPDDPLARTGYTSLYEDKQVRNGKTTAYICREFHCRAPVHTAEAFHEEITASE